MKITVDAIKALEGCPLADEMGSECYTAPFERYPMFKCRNFGGVSFVAGLPVIECASHADPEETLP